MSKGETSIPSPVWNVAASHVREVLDQRIRARQKSNGGSESSRLFVIKKFHYDVTSSDWAGGTGATAVNNMFFEFICSKNTQGKSEEEIAEDFISVSFGDGSSSARSSMLGQQDRTFKYISEPAKEQLLRRGLRSPHDDIFHLLGCSNSQVSESSFIFSRAENTRQNERLICKILPDLASLERKKGVAKRVKYAGLLFSGVHDFVALPKRKTTFLTAPSIFHQTTKADFTDGCGLMSVPVAKAIKRKLGLDQIPTIVQIRYGGTVLSSDTDLRKPSAYLCKGVLLLDPNETERYVVSFRSSMLKVQVSTQSDWLQCMEGKLGIIEWGKRRIGKLNQQLVCLLSATVPRRALLDIQDFHLGMVKKFWNDPVAAGFFIAMEDEFSRWWDQYEDLMLLQNEHIQQSSSTTTTKEHFSSKYVSICQRRRRFCNDRGKLQVHLGSSRLLFGAAVPEILHNMLEEGQCLVFTERGLLSGIVVVSRSPSYCTGDVRVMEAITLPPDCQPTFRQFRNCILFATRGSRPEPDKMSGGDLDGDQYLVIWDSRITEHSYDISQETPETYESSSQQPRTKLDPDDDWITFAARSDNSVLGIVDGAFNTIAKERGVKSEEARELNRLFSDLVDKNPASFKRLEELMGSCYAPHRQGSKWKDENCVWEEMVERQIQCAANLRAGGVVPDKDDFLAFQRRLHPSILQSVSNEINSLSHHFNACVLPSKISKLVDALARRASADNNNFPITVISSSSNSMSRVELCEEFEEKSEGWAKRAEEIFAEPLDQWKKEREILLVKLKRELSLRQSQLNEFDSERQSITQNIDNCKATLTDLQDTTTRYYDLAQAYFSSVKKCGSFMPLSRSENMSGRMLSFMIDVGSVKKKANGYISRGKQVSDDLKRWDEQLQALDAEKEDLLTGKTRERLQFHLERKEQEVESKRVEQRKIEKRIATGKKTIKAMSKDEAKTQGNMEMINTKISNVSSLLERIELYLENVDPEKKGFFTHEMMSESSFRSLHQLVSKFKPCCSPPVFVSFVDPMVCLLDKEGKSISKGRNQNASVLEQYFECASAVNTRISEEEIVYKDRRKILQKKLSELRKEMKSKAANTASVSVTSSSAVDEGGESPKKKKGLKKNSKKNKKSKMDSNPEQQKLSRQIGGTNKELSTIQKFLKLCLEFQMEARGSLNGELSGLLPEDVFLGLEALFEENTDTKPLRQKFLSLKEKGKLLAKDGLSFSVSDREIFSHYKKFIEEAHNFEKREISKAEKDLSVLSEKLQQIEDSIKKTRVECESLSTTSTELGETIENMDVQLQPSRDQLQNIFCAERLDALDKEWEDTGFEDSMNVAMQHIYRCAKEAKEEWGRRFRLEEDPLILEAALTSLDKSMSRICTIEENRVKGFPVQGKKGMRKDRLLVYEKRAEIQRVLSASNAVVITAGTGCGKSTQLPQYIADDFEGLKRDKNGDNRGFARICCTQPRRVAAQGVSSRVATEYMTNIGELVGYRVGTRGGNTAESRKVSATTRIEFVTEGWLLYHLKRSPESISNYDCIIVDEAHERNKETDLLLAMLRNYVRDQKTSGLKVVVMSASIDPSKFCEYFGDCPSVDCPGKMHEVKEFYRPPVGDETEDGAGINTAHVMRVLFDDVIKAYGSATTFEHGDCLVFLSGSRQIEECVQLINKRAQKEKVAVVAYPLYAQMDRSSQEAATNKEHRSGIDGSLKVTEKYVRKVICCTNVAETSLTIDGVRFVLEGGHAKKLRYDHSIRCKGLKEELISKASAKQRRGRAGRVESGFCFYMYSSSTHNSMQDYDKPQILETAVDELILYSLSTSGKSVEELGLLDCPDESEIAAAKERLLDLGMVAPLEKESRIGLTEDGALACSLSSIEPEGVRMLLAASEPSLNCMPRALKLAVIMSADEDLFFRNFKDDKEDCMGSSDSRPSDLGDHLRALGYFEDFERRRNQLNGNGDAPIRLWCRDNGMIYHVANRLQSAIESGYKVLKKRKLLKIHKGQGSNPRNKSGKNERLLRACVAGYFSKIAECNDPQFPPDVSFTMLGRSQFSAKVDDKPHQIIVHLGRDSCLNNLKTSPEVQARNWIIDDEEDVESTDPLDQAVLISYIVFDSLLGINTRRGMLYLAGKASIISGQMIADHAPLSWRERVEFDPNKPSVSRETINNLGRFLLNAIDEQSIKSSFPGLLVKISWSLNMIQIFGSLDIVGCAIDVIKEQIEEARNRRIKNDFASCFSDKQKIAFPQQACTRFGNGMVLETISKEPKKNESISDMLSWFKSHKPLKSNQFEHRRQWNLRYNGNQFTIFTMQGWNVAMIQEIFRDVVTNSWQGPRQRIYICQSQTQNEDTKTLQVLLSLAHVLGSDSKSEEFDRCVEDVIGRLVGNEPDDEHTVKMLHEIGLLLLEAGQLDKSFSFLKGRAEFSDRVVSRDDLVSTLGILGRRYCERGNGALSLQMNEHQLKLRRKIHSDETTKVSDALMDMGNSLALCKRFDDARKAFKDSLHIRPDSHEADDLHASVIQERIGSTHLSDGKIKEAIDCFEKALAARKASLASDDDRLADVLVWLALAHKKEKKLAVKLFGESLEIRTSAGNFTPEAISASLYEAMGIALKGKQAFNEFIAEYSITSEKLFPYGVYTSKKANGKLEAELLTKKPSSMFSRLKSSLSKIEPEAINAEAIPNNFASVLESIGLSTFSLEQWDNIWNNIAVEWVNDSLYWKTFCEEITKDCSENVVILYSPSSQRFEIFAARREIMENARDLLLRRLIAMCAKQNYAIVQLPKPKSFFRRWQLWNVSAIVEELRFKHQSIRFRIVPKLSRDPNTDQSAEGGLSCGCDDTTKDDVLNNDNRQPHLGHNDFEKFEGLHRGGSRVSELCIVAQTTKGRKSLQAALSEIDGLFDMEIEDRPLGETGAVNATFCCMCRRPIQEQQFWKKKTTEANKNDESSTIKGWRLTMCGCVFCRQCFLNSIKLKLKNRFDAQCQQCGSKVLATDCQNIVKPKSSAANENERNSRDWSRLSTLSTFRKCCNLARYSGDNVLICPDCSTVTIYDPKKTFLSCRNLNCPNIFCTSCKRVPITEENHRDCQERRCSACM